MTWKLNPHGMPDKSISIHGPLWLEVDYDDVDTYAVDILVEHFIKFLNEHWEPVYGWHCENEDCKEAYHRWIEYPNFCRGCGESLVERELSST